MNISRRKFLTTSSGIVSCAAAGTGLESCGIGSIFYSSNEIPVTEGAALLSLDHEPALQKIGGAVKKRFSQLNEGNVIIIVRISEKEFTAFGAQCTHWGAEIGFPQEGIFHCPFHGSQFSMQDGTVVDGPASEPLRQFTVVFDVVRQEVRLELKEEQDL